MAVTKNADKVIKTAQSMLMMVAILGLGLLTACSSYQHIIDHQQFSNEVQDGVTFRHRILMNPAAQQASAPQPRPLHWHVYIEGDGRAVDARGRPSLDPTPRTPMLLEMMSKDTSPALYLGRPCYYHTQDPACSPVSWTLARYSEATVASMASALQRSLPGNNPITLIGHSGGGTLAVLLAPRLPNVTGVVTLAGNLQVAEWVQHHGYSPLSLSLDPATQPPLPECIQQVHIAGALDKEILPRWIEAFSQAQPNAHYLSIERADHRSGWPFWWTLINLDTTIDSMCDKVTR